MQLCFNRPHVKGLNYNGTALLPIHHQFHIKVELGSVKLARMRTLAGPVTIHNFFCHLLSATGAIVNVYNRYYTEILCECEDREELLERLKDPLSNNKQG